MAKRICTAITEKGVRCQAVAMRGTKPLRCFFHNPASKEAHKLATAKGGELARRKPKFAPKESPAPKFRTAKDVVRFLQRVSWQMLTGQLDRRIATGLAYVSNIALIGLRAGGADPARVELLITPPADAAIPNDKFLEQYAKELKQHPMLAADRVLPSDQPQPTKPVDKSERNKGVAFSVPISRA